MKQFEYKLLPHPIVLHELNQLGAEGWELIQDLPIYFLFKREKFFTLGEETSPPQPEIPLQGYNLGKGYVTVGTRVLYSLSDEKVISGIVTDLTQDGDVTIQPDCEQPKRFTTKWHYVKPQI